MWGAGDYRDVMPFLSTNSSGIVVYHDVHSVGATAHIVVAKSGVELASGDFSLAYPATYVTVTCQSLAGLTIYAKDSSNKSIENAQVNLNWEDLGGVPWAISQTIDSQGKTIFQQMSFYAYQVQVLWQGLLVHQGTFTFSETSRNYTAHCDVHDLTVEVFDAENKPISDSKVTITRMSDQWELPSKYTDDDGVAVFPLLAGSNYNVDVFYGTYSNTTTISLSSSQTLTVRIDFVIYEFHSLIAVLATMSVATVIIAKRKLIVRAR
jgi:hypothetical protein